MFPKNLNKTALIYKDEIISYTELLTNTAAFAAAFKIKKGERVLIFSQNRPEWIYAFFAVWYQKGIAVPVDVTITASDLAYIIGDSTPKCIFCSKGEKEKVSRVLRTVKSKAQVLVIDQLIKKKEFYTKSSIREKTVENRKDTAVILYTSGTTGNPKGVMLSYDNFQANLESIQDRQLLGKDDVLLSLLPFHHVFPLVTNVLVPLHIGATSVMVTSLDKDEILSNMQKYQVTVMIGIPRLYERFHAGLMVKINAKLIAKWLFKLAHLINNLDFSRKIFKQVHAAFGGKVRLYVTGGAKMDPKVAQDLWALGFKILEGYGATETAPLIAANPQNRIKLGTVGKAISNCEIKLANQEILVKGRNVMQGYYKKTVATRKALKQGWYHTGDLGELDQEDYLTITGRKDELIVLPNGKNITPEEIEKNLQKTSSLVQDAAVLLKNGLLMALVYPDFASLGSQDINSALEKIKLQVISKYNESVPNHKKILNVMVVKEPLPRTRLGKLRRFLLKDIAAKQKLEMKPYEEPQYEEYFLLRDFLMQLKSTKVYPFEHFEMDLGLDSLDIVTLLSYIETTFGMTIRKEDLYKHAPLSKLAAFIHKQKKGVTTEALDWKKILDASRLKVTDKKKPNIFLEKVIRRFLHNYFKVSAQGLRDIPQPPFIFAANHLSYLDAPLIASVLDKKVLDDTYFIMKEKLVLYSLARFLSRGKIISVNTDKDIKGALQKIAAYLKKGKNFLIFPEGTRSRDGKTGTFKKSFAILSRELQVPIVPVTIQGTYQALPRGRIIPRRTQLRIHFGKPIQPKKHDYLTLTRKVETSVRKQIDKQE